MSREIIAGTALSQARKVSGLSQHEMGKRLGLSQVRISQLEKDPSSMSLSMLADAYHSVNTDGKVLLERMVSDFFIG